MITAASPAVSRALDGVGDFFRDRGTREGVVARRLLGRSNPGDAELTEHLIRQRRRKTRMDGSVDGSLVRTAWTAIELMDLGCAPDHAAVVRTIGFLTAAEERSGHFGEGCSDERHARRLCRHYLSGFFSAGTWDDAVAPLAFPSGVVAEGEPQARFAASCFALRAALRAGEDRRPAVRRHVQSLLALQSLWDASDSTWTPDLVFFALGALAHAPIEFRERAAGLADAVVARLDPEHGWPDAHLFHALDMLLGFAAPVARVTVQRIAPLLCTLQRASGAFDGDREEASLIALRALRLALE
jgi:hypothetical protein